MLVVPEYSVSVYRDISGENPLENEAVKEIALRHHVTPAQVLLRHLAQQEVAVIPKSSNPSRIQLNYQVRSPSWDSIPSNKNNAMIYCFQFFE